MSRQPRSPRPRLALALLVIVTTLTGIGLSIMSVAYPAMVEDFDDWSATDLSWITNVFTIIGAGTLIPAGVIADRTGRKRLVLVGVGLFTLGSLLGALAPSPEVLIIARSIQALGASAYTPAAAALLIASYPPERLSFAVGIWAAAGGVSSAIGPSLGGAIVEWGGWEWAFWLTVPPGLIVLLLGPSTFVEPPRNEGQPIPDPFGALLLMASTALAVLGVVRGDDWGWTSPATLAAIGAGVAGIAAVLRRSAHHPTPLIDVDLLRIPSLRAANVGILVLSPAWFATFFGLILFMTNVWDYTVLRAGVVTVPLALFAGVLGMMTGRLAGRTGHRIFIVPGSALFVVSTLFLWIRLDAEPDLWATMVPGVMLLGISSGLAFPALIAAGVVDAPPDRHGLASAIGFTTQRIGATLGVAVAATILAAGDSSSVASYDRLFVVMVTCGVIAVVAGSFVDTRPREAAVDDAEPTNPKTT